MGETGWKDEQIFSKQQEMLGNFPKVTQLGNVRVEIQAQSAS